MFGCSFIPQWTLGLFLLLAIMNTTFNISDRISKSLLLVLLGIQLAEELLGHIVILFVNFWIKDKVSTKAAVSFCISNSSAKMFQFLLVTQHGLLISIVKNRSHPHTGFALLVTSCG